MKFLIIFILIIFSAIATAAEWKDIDGIYAVTPEGYLDPATSEPQDTHYRVQLRGHTAKDLYDVMIVEPVIDDCTGGLAKNIEDMQCLYFEKSGTYECHFSIRLATQEIEYGVAC